jgi:phosphoglycolate phosphatase-like HAD superfamily hydrolase
MVLEVLPDARGGKDLALTALARQLHCKTIMCLGDDATDVAMFRAALDLAKSDGLHVLLVGVSGGHETPEEITDLADVVVRSPEEALEGLETLARALGV